MRGERPCGLRKPTLQVAVLDSRVNQKADMRAGNIIAIALEYDAVSSGPICSRQMRSAFCEAKAARRQRVRDTIKRRHIDLSGRLGTVTGRATAGERGGVFLPRRRDEQVREIRGAVFVGHQRRMCHARGGVERTAVLAILFKGFGV